MERRLPLEEINGLIAFHKKLSRGRDRDRLKCIIYWGKGWTWEAIKDALFINDSTIKAYLDRYEADGTRGLLNNSYRRNNNKLTEEETQRLCTYIDRYNVQSSAQACEYVKKNFGKSFTTNGMTQTLKRLGYSYKKPKRRPAQVDTYLQAWFLVKYFILMEYLKENEAVWFVDATGFVHNSKMDYGWIRKGKTKEIRSNTGRKKVNVNGAYNPKTKEIITVHQETNIKTQSNIDLINTIIKKNPEIKKHTLILDNARMNHSRQLREYIADLPVEIELLHLPSYSPHLNLIERLWKFSKKKILSNQYYASFVQFKETLIHFFDTRIHKFKSELKSLLTENFQTYTPLPLRI